MKYFKSFLLIIIIVLMICSCRTKDDEQQNFTHIALSDSKITLNGQPVTANKSGAVYVANDIVYYEQGKDFTYGEGNQKDAHSKDDAAAHTVLHITKAGVYSISGKLSRGQIAVDLGKDAKKDPNAMVTLVLNGVDINCDVAPAVIFYNVYECSKADEDTATKDVDTKCAGANVVIADDTTNTISGAYVEKIYKPESVILDDEKTEVEDADTLHKYDGAFYSKMSMNINGEKKGNGVLNINATNEGLDSELHLTINGGIININSGNDGINTNEDEVSVTTINGGELTINVTGQTGEGDGIDSNGWLVINGGKVQAYACANSADAGIDSDMGIHINGGTVIASGNMLDRIENSFQNYAVFSFSKRQSANTEVYLKNEAGEIVMQASPKNDYSVLILSSPDLSAGTYTLWSGENKLSAVSGSGTRPEGMQPPKDMENMRPPEFDGNEPPEKPNMPQFDGDEQPQIPQMPSEQSTQQASEQFIIKDGANMFSKVA